MWQASLKVIAKKASQAIHNLDRFPVLQKMTGTHRRWVGHRQSSGGRSQTAAGRRLRTNPERLSVAAAEASAEPEQLPSCETQRPTAIQPEKCSQPLDAGRLPEILDGHVSGVGRKVSG
jgi:hypothetical protein